MVDKEMNMREKLNVGRRSFLFQAFCGVSAFGKATPKSMSIAESAAFVKPGKKWTDEDFYQFLQFLPAQAMLDLKKNQELLNSKASGKHLNGPDQDARDLQAHAHWISSNVLEYPFHKAKNLDYHKLVVWVGEEAGIHQKRLNKSSTFAIEHELHELLFAQMWDKLSRKERRDLLAKIDPNDGIKNKAEKVIMGGHAALRALSATVALKGFPFYSSMSTTIAAVANTMGVTLPFSAYSGASAVLGVLSGPVGWAVMAVASIGSLAFVGRADLKKTTALIMQIHSLKVEALAAAGVPENEVFR